MGKSGEDERGLLAPGFGGRLNGPQGPEWRPNGFRPAGQRRTALQPELSIADNAVPG